MQTDINSDVMSKVIEIANVEMIKMEGVGNAGKVLQEINAIFMKWANKYRVKRKKKIRFNKNTRMFY